MSFLGTFVEDRIDRVALTILKDGEVVDRTVSFGELDQLMRSVAGMLQERSARGRRALIATRDPVDFIAAVLGCFCSGTIAVPMPIGRLFKRAEFTHHIALDCSADFLLVSGEDDRAAAFRDRGLRGLDLETVSLKGIDAEAIRTCRIPTLAPTSIAYLQYTSGSTSLPRGAMITHGSLIANIRIIASRFAVTVNDCYVQWLPLFHDMGLVSLLCALRSGARSVLFSPTSFAKRPLRWLEAISRHRGTLSGGPSFAYEACIKAAADGIRGLDLSSWRIAFCGAEPIDAATLTRFAKHFAPARFSSRSFFPAYGLAEFTLLVSGGMPGPELHTVRARRDELAKGRFVAADATSSEIDCVSLVACGGIPEMSCVVIADHERSIALTDEHVGEIWVSGPSAAAGYWDKPEQNAETFGAHLVDGRGPFLRTGDLGFLRKGRLFITGRLKDVLVVNGRKYYPQDIELTVARSCAGLRMGGGAAFMRGISSTARVVVVQELEHRAKIDGKAAVQAIRQAVRENHGLELAEIALLRTGTIPRTTSGKLRRVECARLFQRGEIKGIVFRWADLRSHLTVATARDREEPPADDRMERIVAAVMHRVCSLTHIDLRGIDPASSTLNDLGMDSVMMAQLAFELEGVAGTAVPIAMLSPGRSLRDIAAALAEKSAPAALERWLGAPDGSPSVVNSAAARTVRPALAPPVDAISIYPDLPPRDPDAYGTHARPELVRRLSALRLDRQFIAARGDRLWCIAEHSTREVVDLVGGYGATILGHNHPEIIAAARAALGKELPVHAQISIRSYSGRLARMLSDKLKAVSGRDFVATFCSTGAEAVEAALRHAHLEYERRRQEMLDGLDGDAALLELELQSAAQRIDGILIGKLREKIAPEIAGDPSALIAAITARACAALLEAPDVLAPRGAFHGRTRGAATITFHDPLEQRNGSGAARNVAWLDPGDLEGLERMVAARIATFDVLKRDHNGIWSIAQKEFCRIAAIVVEPIQGEGGVRELSREFFGSLRRIADRWGIPIIADEIQTGMGRTGTFSASTAAGLDPDYYLFGKSLGGGLAKISALLVDAKRYQSNFGVHYGSTFGDDDFSAVIAVRALEILDQENVCGRAERTGLRLLHELRALQRNWPRVIADIRGRGCLIGIEFADPTTAASPAIRFIGSNLGYVASSYLLNRHDVRIMPTLSDPLTVRLEPSAFLSDAEIERVIEALADLCQVIDAEDAGALLGHLVDAPVHGVPRKRASSRTSGCSLPQARGVPRVAFLTYLPDLAALTRWDPSLETIPPSRHDELISALGRVTPPRVIQETRVRSQTGAAVDFSLIGLMMTSAHIKASFANGQRGVLLNQLAQAADLARENGCSLVGFGGYLSILTSNCRSVLSATIGATSGNTLTVGMGCEAVRSWSRLHERNLARCRLAVIGGGNIGLGVARYLEEEVGRISVVGRPGTRASLEEVVASGNPSIEVADQIEIMRAADIIIAASNEPAPLLYPEHLGPGPRLVVDIAIPANVADEVRRVRSDVTVVPGGLVQLPDNVDVDLTFGALPRNQIYACMAETLLLGLEGQIGNAGTGVIEPAAVQRMLACARDHAFTPIIPL
jgi:acetylornithine/succinyldiaminopimelate/putrescine aminotransferase/acyl-CoA synthetase (AMP-forming)/AMP-acid ligase II/predicted amino acid dehydrogenase/acyl carrier protein